MHGNLQGLNRFCEHLKNNSYDHIVFLGDAVGYGAKPGECVEIIDKIATIKLIGNHDAAVMGQLEIDYFNPQAQLALQWTSQNISPGQKKIMQNWLYSTVLKVNDVNIGLAHASFYSPRSWTYILNGNEARMEFKLTGENSLFIIMVAHSHIPGFFQYDPAQESVDQYILGTFNLALLSNYRYIINSGSIGQPRDRDPRSSFAVLDLEEQFVKIIRVEYDIKRTEQEILQAGLPKQLAYRLNKGY